MNRNRFLVLAIAVAGFLSLSSTSVEAQDGWRNVLPRGRLIKRLRDDFNKGKPFIRNPFDDPNPALRPPTPSKARPNPTRANPTRPTRPNPTVAQPGKPRTSPTRAADPRVRVPQPAKKPSKPTIKLKSQVGSGVRSLNDDSAIAPLAGSAGPARQQATVHRDKEFGMVVAKIREDLVVSEVTSGGNAAAAGLRRGDAILQIGGAPLLSVEELDAIAKSMRGGDRVEFEFSRRGKKSKAVVQFGQPAPLPAATDESAPSQTPAAGEASQRRLVGDNQPASGDGLQSVFENSSSGSGSRTEQLELELPPLELEPPKN